MNAAPPTAAPRRRIWRWVLLGVGLCLAPIVLLALVAVSFLTLDRDATALRKQVMAATASDWHTKVQLSVGRATLGAVRAGLSLVQDKKEVEEARLALAAVRHASVGVYERKAGVPVEWSREQLFSGTDRVMNKCGWTRLVGVADHQDTVLVYVSTDMVVDEPVELCAAVVNGRELVVVSTSVDAAILADLAAQHAPDDLKRRLRLSRF
jgi:hypothetical protein